MQMRMSVKHMLILLLLAVFAGCQRIPLYERTTAVDLNLALNLRLEYELDFALETELDPELSLKVNGKEPDYFQALFYDKKTDELVKSQIVGREGGMINVPSGEYHLVVYNFGTESTQIGSLHHREEAEAYTSDITKSMSDRFKAIQSSAIKLKSPSRGYDDDPIIHEPDHLYVANEPDIVIPAFTGKEETITIYASARSVIDLYSLEVLNIKGTENINKVDAFITGQVKSNYFGKAERSYESANLYTEMQTDRTSGCIYTVFGTFGKQPGEENLVYLDITDNGGGKYRYIFDVTDQFDDPNNTGHRLIVDGSIIDIPKPEHGGGGLAPSVDKWENENIDVPLG